jgi:acetyl esterase/lipase
MRNNGTEPCEWLNSIGVTAILLKYRTPTRDEANPSEKPSADALRAIGLVRHHASEWGLDPKRVGILAFSAGGTMLGHVACDHGPRSYPMNPELDDVRGPDFGIMAYGGGFLDKDDKSKFQQGFSVPADAPPMFFVSAHDDKIANPMDVAMLYLEYKRRGIPAEIHIYAHGGHGFGVKKGTLPVNTWTQRCAEWMAAMGYLPKP